MTTTTPAAGRFCSTYTSEIGADPIGSAWAVDRYIAIEFPLPWPYDVLAARHLPDGLDDVISKTYTEGPEIGFLGIAPDEACSVPGYTRVIDCHTIPGFAHRYYRHEYLIPTGEVVTTLAALFEDPEADAAVPYRLPETGVRDLLVCTQGTVDICCGTFGYPAYRILRRIAESTGGQVRAWRCTHFGGHRFAPTAFELPEGRYWGLLDMNDLARLVHRDRPASDLAAKYRGSALLPHEIQQVAERLLFVEAGWAWSSWQVEVSAPDPIGDDLWCVEFGWSDPESGHSGCATVEVRQTGTISVQEGSGDPELVDVARYDARILTRTGAILDAPRYPTAPGQSGSCMSAIVRSLDGPPRLEPVEFTSCFNTHCDCAG